MKNETLKILKIIWSIAFVLGVFGIVQKFTTGERLAGYGSYVPWGLWVAIYFHAIGIAGGVFFVGTLGYLFGVKGLKENLPVIIWISLVAVITGLLAIWLDLGKMWRFYRIITAPSFTSMLAFNAWLYTVFIGTSLVCLVLNKNKKSRDCVTDKSGWLAPVLIFGMALAIVFPSQSGAFFGVVDAKPYWNSALMPIMFLASAIASGASVLLLADTFIVPERFNTDQQPIKYLRRVAIGAVIAYLFFEFSEFSISFWGPISHARESLGLVLFGPFWWVFWIVHLCGAIIGLVLLLRCSLPAVGTGAFIIAFTFLSTRLNVLIPGQAVSEIEGLKQAFTHQRLNYFYQATTNEYLVALFLGALAVGLIYLGLKKMHYFDIQEVKTP